MSDIRLYKDSLLRLSWTGVFAGAASDAKIIVQFGEDQFPFIGDHFYCFGGAMLGASAAILFVLYDDAFIFQESRLADLREFLRFEVER